MNTSLALQSIQDSLVYLLSDWVLVFTFFIAFFLDVFVRRTKLIGIISLIGMVFSLYLLINQYLEFDEKVVLFNGFYVLTSAALSFKLLISIAGIISILPFVLGAFKNTKPEFFYLFPILIFSANLMCMSNNLLSIYLGLEFLSILSFTYIAFDIRARSNAESSSKYILFGLFASAIMLYGISWLYGLSGTLYLDSEFLSTLSRAPQTLVVMAILMFSAGFMYKISAVPFHYYTPDVYEGSQASTISFISTIPKLAGFAVLFAFVNRFHFEYQGTMLVWPHFPWQKVLAVVSIATMFLGNLSALSQSNLKRIMAYSSISHTGFLIMGLVVYSTTGLDALLYYSLVFLISNLAVFFLLQYWENRFEITELNHLIGIGKEQPFLNSLMIIILASLTGLPPLSGFVAKFFVFSSVFEQYQLNFEPLLLVVLVGGVINTVVALFYYFNIARYIYLKTEPINLKITSMSSDFQSKLLYLLLAILVFGLILLGIYPVLV